MNPQEEHDTSGIGKTGSIIRAIFGIFMVIVYVGMGVLMFINFFNFPEGGPWGWSRYVIGTLLVVYGFWRGYRQWKGLDYTNR